MCFVDCMLSFELLALTITVWLSQFIRIAGTGLSTTGKSIKSSRSHSASTHDVSNAVSSASIIDLVRIVCLQDFQETAPPPSVNTYPLVAFISSASDIQLESLYLSSIVGHDRVREQPTPQRLGERHPLATR